MRRSVACWVPIRAPLAEPMSADVSLRATAAVRQLAPYQPGKPISELERELGITGIVKLASNENPLGPGAAVLAAIADAAPDS
jgi:histidinol-phosphate aminotransferase